MARGLTVSSGSTFCKAWRNTWSTMLCWSRTRGTWNAEQRVERLLLRCRYSIVLSIPGDETHSGGAILRCFFRCSRLTTKAKALVLYCCLFSNNEIKPLGGQGVGPTVPQLCVLSFSRLPCPALRPNIELKDWRDTMPLRV